MQKPYLIQRGVCHPKTERKGLDSIVNFDYMGSSEFEFGALPQSLKVIRASLADYSIMRCEFQGLRLLNPVDPYKRHNRPPKNYVSKYVQENRPITVFCRKDQETEVKDALALLAGVPNPLENSISNNLRLKEASHFDTYIAGRQSPFLKADFWWDIENHFMFWATNETFDKDFQEAIQPITQEQT